MIDNITQGFIKVSSLLSSLSYVKRAHDIFMFRIVSLLIKMLGMDVSKCSLWHDWEYVYMAPLHILTSSFNIDMNAFM